MTSDVPLQPARRKALWQQPGRTVIGLACAVAVPSLLASLIFAVGNGLSATDAFFGATVLAFYGTMSILSLFLPMILWRLPRAQDTLVTCIGTGAISGPGLIGYVALFQKLGFALPLLAVGLGAVGGGVFWLVAVRPLSSRAPTS